ncbi:MAG: ornithine carbamoyltransferase [Myxococcales bacterium]|nr:ornithine carbamoyltransferase [Myxococcales bacterium]
MNPLRPSDCNYLTELDFDVITTQSIIDLAAQLKSERKYGEFRSALNGQSVALYFEKPSVRTRVSFTVGVHELGGNVVELSGSNTKVGKGENAADFASVLGRYVRVIVARVFSQRTLTEMASHAGVPVINALSDERHPCQALADALTIQERLGTIRGRRFAFVGEGNNVATSTGLLLAMLGAEVWIASPDGYGLPEEIIRSAVGLSGSVYQCIDPKEAVQGASVVYTDTWVSMGQEEEAEARRQIFAGYKVDESLMASADSNAVVMHCLPAVRDEEISSSLMYHPSSAIWDQAENRLHVQKALILNLLRSPRR